MKKSIKKYKILLFFCLIMSIVSVSKQLYTKNSCNKYLYDEAGIVEDLGKAIHNQQIDGGEENWNEITAPFFEMTKHEIPRKTFWDVFGELL